MPHTSKSAVGTLSFVSRLAMAALMSAAMFGCGDGAEYIVVDKEDDVRAVGDACVLNDDCETGRCVGGVCNDGLCEDDAECATNEVCVYGGCQPVDDFACTSGQAPQVNVDTLSISYGEVAVGNSGTETVTITNGGSCIMTVSGVALRDDSDPDYSCNPCSLSDYTPARQLLPGRTLEVEVTFAPQATGEAIGAVEIATDDPQQPLVTVELHATYSGVPNIIIDPPELHFGTVPSGTDRTETITIRNEGSGNAVLTIQSIYIIGHDAFTIPTDFALIEPPSPLLLPPYNPNDPDTIVEVPVTLTPGITIDDFEAELKVQAHFGDPSASERFATFLTGTSKGPPTIEVTPDLHIFKEDDGTAYPLGTVSARQVYISNTGESDLMVDVIVADPQGDFTVSPTFIPPIAPGGQFLINVFFNPSAPSDPINEHDPTVPFFAALNVTSNDTESPLSTVNLEGWSRGGTFDDILKLEMEYENADNSWAGNDYRNVDLEFISPLGFSCSKPIYSYVPDGNGGFVIDPQATVYPCDEWTDSGLTGTASWIALGQYEEPERVMLYGLGQELLDGDVFTARIHYMEDCANIPSGILGDIIGIGASALLGILGGAIGVPIALDPGSISDLVTENCWDHESSNTIVHVFINGQEVASPVHRLQDKGDYFDIVKLRRENGQFVLLTEE